MINITVSVVSQHYPWARDSLAALLRAAGLRVVDHSKGRRNHAIIDSSRALTGIQMLLAEQLPQRELRKLVTDSRTLRDHPDLATYYTNRADRLKLEAEEYVRFMRQAGDPKPLDEPNHYFGRTALFDYLVAKDKLKQAKEADILAALNAQAQQQEGCFSCHSLHGRGGKIGPDLGIEGTRKRSDAWLVNHFKDPQVYSPSSVMPSFGGLTGGQLQTLSNFLEYQEEGK